MTDGPTVDAQRRILATGAIERDNFGDLLYALLLRDRLDGRWPIAWGAPIAADDSPVVGEVDNWAHLLADEDFVACWVLGGEVGATPPEYAYLTTHGVAARRELSGSPSDDAHAALAEAMGGEVLDPPYVPRLSRYARNAGTPLIINSVGVSGIRHEPSWRQPRLIAALREASFISVRDRASSVYLTEIGVEHRLAPDFAHTVAELRPGSPRPTGPVLVHLSEQALARRDADVWATALQTALPDDAVPVRFITAGLAPGHDTEASAHALRNALHRLSPNREVTVSPARGVWDRVDEIAGARLWIGASLHGRIVASAYGVPRVSTDKPKVDVYCRDWDSEQPFGVTPDSLPAAVTAAFDGPHAPREDLAEAARQNFTAAVSAMKAVATADRSEILRLRLDALQHEVEDSTAVARRCEQGLDSMSSRAAALQREVDAMRGSRRWQLFASIDRVRARLGV